MHSVLHSRLLIAILLVFAFATSSSAPRKVLAELFTNVGCSPCYNADNYYFNTYLKTNPDAARVVTITYHVYWPSPTDPMYTANPVPVEGRNLFYNNNIVPHMFLDGVVDGQHLYSTWAQLIANRLTQSSPISITLSGGRNGQTLDLNAAIFAETAVSSSSWKIFWVMVEGEISSPQWNGTTWVPFVHHWVHRAMYPDAGGTGLSIAQGQTVNSRKSITLNQSWSSTNCKVIVFIQNVSTKEVINAEVISVADLATRVADEKALPASFSLQQNYPNPFNPSTEIRYELPEESHVRLRLFNSLGQEVRTLVDANASAGIHTVKLDASQLASGIYIYKIEAGRHAAIRTMMVIR